MLRSNRRLVLAVFAVVLTAGTAVAQQTPPPKPTTTVPANPDPKPVAEEKRAEPSTLDRTWDETKAMTRKQWNAAKTKWATEKVKWRDCNRQSAAEKLKAPKSWSFIASCMTKA
jgi:hypothetical protein